MQQIDCESRGRNPVDTRMRSHFDFGKKKEQCNGSNNYDRCIVVEKFSDCGHENIRIDQTARQPHTTYRKCGRSGVNGQIPPPSTVPGPTRGIEANIPCKKVQPDERYYRITVLEEKKQIVGIPAIRLNKKEQQKQDLQSAPRTTIDQQVQYGCNQIKQKIMNCKPITRPGARRKQFEGGGIRTAA